MRRHHAQTSQKPMSGLNIQAGCITGGLAPALPLPRIMRVSAFVGRRVGTRPTISSEHAEIDFCWAAGWQPLAVAGIWGIASMAIKKPRQSGAKSASTKGTR